MGGKPSRDDFRENQEFMNEVRKSQQVIIKESETAVVEFFKSVDVLLAKQGSIESGKIEDMEKKDADQMKKVEEARQKALSGAPVTPAPAPPATDNVAKSDEKDPLAIPEVTVVNHKPAADILVLLNQATVYYVETQKKDAGVIKAIVESLKKVVTGVVAGAAGAAGGTAAGPVGAAAAALFKTPEAVKGVVDGVTGCVDALVSSLDSNMTVSSSLQKRIQFVAPGCYCATYYTTSVFKFKGREGDLSYELKCGAIYVATSVKLMQIITSLAMYRTISESFERQLALMEETLNQFIFALQDAAYFSTKFGFSDSDYNTMMSRLKTNIMKDVVTNFWTALKDESNKDRVAAWNGFVKDGDLKTTISTTQEAYDEAYKALKKYYQDFVLNPPVAK